MSKVNPLSVTFEPHGRKVSVLPGASLVEAAAAAGITLNTPCGGQGTCGKCRVRISMNPPQPSESECLLLSESDLAQGIRLACKTYVQAPMIVEVPSTSILGGAFKILGSESNGAADASDPVARTVPFSCPSPVRDDPRSDFRRLSDQIGEPLTAGIGVLRELPEFLRTHNFAGHATIVDGELVNLTASDSPPSRCTGIAFDIGTTTLVGALTDLCSGDELSCVARMNPQTRFGDDVLSRILITRQETDGLARLRSCLMESVNEMVAELVRAAGISAREICHASFAGNTTMQHILTGLHPGALGETPFAPVLDHAIRMSALEMGLDIHPRGRVYVLPVIGGFVGGDTVAGLIATRLWESERPTLLVDIGTNGEIVLCHGGELVAASTAAGPAFEGARIQCGMRATAGAIEKVVLEGDDISINVLGGIAPTGLCGSALIDCVAVLLRSGILIGQGMLLAGSDLPADLPEPLRNRVRESEAGTEFVLASGEESGTGIPVVLTQRDIRELQLASAAIRAGINILLSRVGLTASDLDRVLLAGGFGNFLRRNNAQRIGLLPGELAHHRIVYAGNTALVGARNTLCSKQACAEAERIARVTRHIDLSLDQDFQNEYMMGMFFPDA